MSYLVKFDTIQGINNNWFAIQFIEYSDKTIKTVKKEKANSKEEAEKILEGFKNQFWK